MVEQASSTKNANQRFAVIDLGTNTFHLLIAEPKDDRDGLKEVYRSRKFIKLAEKGIETISPSALARGMDALMIFRQQIDAHQVDQDRVCALGTAALRTASNGPAFQAEVKSKTNIDIQIISGDQEAALIAKGALLAIPRPTEKVLIMDIGGGSVEFIITDQQKIYWARSFPIGVAVLYRQFHHHEPITIEEIEATKSYLTQQLLPLKSALEEYATFHLIGAAGTFDVLADQIGNANADAPFAHIDLKKFDALFKRILKTTKEERHQMPEIPDDRADMIVVALILIDIILNMARINQLTVSFYSMKEGMLAKLIEKSRDQ